MSRILLFVFVCVALCAAAPRFKSLTPMDLDNLPRISKHQYDSKRSGLPMESGPAITSFAAIDEEFVGKTKPHSKRKAMERAMERALENDQLMYSGNTFVPPPGHDLHFDFIGFHKYAQRTHKAAKKAVRKMEKSYSNNTEIKTEKMLAACLEINVCAINPDVTGTPNVCGQFGIQGDIVLETVNGNKQTLKLTATLNAGVSTGVTGAFAISVFVSGSATWEWAIDTTGSNKPYTEVYTALYAAIQYRLNGYKLSRPMNAKLLGYAAIARNDLMDDSKNGKEDVPQQNAQGDELMGLVLIHYNILDMYTDSVKNVADSAFAEAKKKLELAVYKSIFKPNDSNWGKAQGKSNLHDMMVNDDLKCSDMLKVSNNRNPKTALNNDYVLFCALMKYGVMMPAGERKTGTWGKGSKNNVMNMIPYIYGELMPSDANSFHAIKAQLDEWQTAYKAVAATEWRSTQTITVPENPGSSTAAASRNNFVRTVPIVKVSAVAVADPCDVARQLFQTLALPSSAIQHGLSASGAVSGPEPFAMTKIVLSGTVGVTMGLGRVGYCTADSNSVQGGVSCSIEYNVVEGKWDKDSKQCGMGFSFFLSSYFSFQGYLGFKQATEDSPDSVGFKISIPSGTDLGNWGQPDKWTTAVNFAKTALAAIKNNWNNRNANKGTQKAAFTASKDSFLTQGTLDKLAVAYQFSAATATSLRKALFSAGIDMIIQALLSLSPLEASTMMEISVDYLYWPQGAAEKAKLELTVANTRVYKLALANVNFYLISGDSVSFTSGVF